MWHTQRYLCEIKQKHRKSRHITTNMNKSSLHTKVKYEIFHNIVYSIQYHKLNKDIMGSSKFLVETGMKEQKMIFTRKTFEVMQQMQQQCSPPRLQTSVLLWMACSLGHSVCSNTKVINLKAIILSFILIFHFSHHEWHRGKFLCFYASF